MPLTITRTLRLWSGLISTITPAITLRQPTSSTIHHERVTSRSASTDARSPDGSVLGGSDIDTLLRAGCNADTGIRRAEVVRAHPVTEQVGVPTGGRAARARSRR